MPQPPLSREEAERRIAAINEALKAGYRPRGMTGHGPGAIAVAAQALGMSEKTLQPCIPRIKQLHDLEPDWSLWKRPEPQYIVKGVSTLTGPNGETRGEWTKTRLAGREDGDVTHIPDPKIITKVSTYYDQTGAVTGQWVSEKPEDLAKEALWREFAAGLAEELPRAKPTKAPKETASTLLACYPVGDHHLGMLAWHEETGADYDIGIAERLLNDASGHLINSAPACDRSVVVFLGDFMHYDSFKPVTPMHGNLLDADSRFPKMVRAAVRSMRGMIDTALHRHGQVRVIVEIGNHDLSSSIFLMECLRNVYENEPRVVVDTSPRMFHYFDFGKNLVGTHHGHNVKMKDLPLIMATDKPEEWGRTTHRYIWTGHVHHDHVQEFAGCIVESFRVLASPDAYSACKYRAGRSMKSIILHAEHGEVARNTVNPAMFQVAA